MVTTNEPATAQQQFCAGLTLAPGVRCEHPDAGVAGALAPAAGDVAADAGSADGSLRVDDVELPTSNVTQDYLKAIYNIGEWGPDGASTSELAARLGVGAPTVSENVQRLAGAGLVHYKPYRRVTLTVQGRRVALAMVRRHRLMETYLALQLGYGWDEVHDDAEQLEHSVSDRLLGRMDDVLGHPVRDPHGDPIPQPDGTVALPRAHRLDDVTPGQPVRIARISDAEPELLREISDHDLDLDTEIEAGAVDLSTEATAAIWVTRA
ncbi:metal-dependent transcriptional regulator [Occultella aeris]|uniref:Manganese transport regulator n=1 Tax=Occultella aeris TaxID=2761496 RepID=A0A7M4DLE0_9MICO|nr:metal-dependent transcriptional regulator [Occultella aeris]VZO38076.1 Iron-dependent repressor IdeR [Occultella aeris]